MINPNTLEIHMLMEQHNPLLDTSGYMAAGIIGCDCDDRKFTSDSAYFEHLAGVLAAALPPAGETEWAVQYAGVLISKHPTEESARETAASKAKAVVLTRMITPWQPAD